jgi:hypothetical protein
MPRQRNPYGVTRDLEAPYMVFKSADGQWEVRVLKTYKLPASELKDPYARWFCATKSPYTFGGWEWGDAYRNEIESNFIKVFQE